MTWGGGGGCPRRATELRLIPQASLPEQPTRFFFPSPQPGLAPGLRSLRWRAITGIGTPAWTTTCFFHSAFPSLCFYHQKILTSCFIVKLLENSAISPWFGKATPQCLLQATGPLSCFYFGINPLFRIVFLVQSFLSDKVCTLKRIYLKQNKQMRVRVVVQTVRVAVLGEGRGADCTCDCAQ